MGGTRGWRIVPNTGWNLNIREMWLIVRLDGTVVRGWESRSRAVAFMRAAGEMRRNRAS